MKHHLNHSLGVWTSVHYNTHASPVTALHWLYLSQRGGRHSQWACVLLSRWILIYSTHFLRIYKTISSLNKTAKNAKNGKNFIQADSQFLQSDLAPLSPWVPLPPSVHIDGFHYPHWVNSCGSFALSIYSYLLLWNIFSFISNTSDFNYCPFLCRFWSFWVLWGYIWGLGKVLKLFWGIVI